ncbi:MAG: glucokinase [Chloroflexi bacterium]|jgi:glucokinase|nr:MAG: glucokinase [Chloroflexota bacterium]
MKSALTLGVDIGGTKVMAGLVSPIGDVVSTTCFPSGYELSVGQFIDRISTSVKHLQNVSGATAVAIGVGAAGLIEKDSGIVVTSPNLKKWTGVPLKQILQDAFNIPSFVTNDVRAAVFSEWHSGVGKDTNDLVCLFVGTGIGCGIITEGRLLSGKSGYAGELGHTTIDVNGPLCRCGNRGCLESMAGGWGIASRAQKVVMLNPVIGAVMLELAHGKIEDISAATVSQAFQQNDPLATELMECTAEYLAVGVKSIVNIFNPSKIILGGGVIEGTEKLIDMIRVHTTNALDTDVEIVKSRLGGNATVVGAALMATATIKT